MTDLSAEFKALSQYKPKHKVRFVTAASLFDGHDAAINIMRRILQGMGAEVISALEARGHRVKPVPDLEGPCSVEAIRVLDNGVRMAASDPRRDGWAGAW
jgi:gamma-glutamyltranspeptidase